MKKAMVGLWEGKGGGQVARLEGLGRGSEGDRRGVFTAWSAPAPRALPLRPHLLSGPPRSKQTRVTVIHR